MIVSDFTALPVELPPSRARSSARSRTRSNDWLCGQGAGNDYADVAKAFLLDASDGTVVYGSSLMQWV
jgi:hypothetical protein